MKPNDKNTYREVILWWERLRWIPNVIIICESIILLYEFWDYPMRHIRGTASVIKESIVFLIVLNSCYTFSWVLEIASCYLWKFPPRGGKSRWILFGVGVFASVIITNLFYVFLFDALFAY